MKPKRVSNSKNKNMSKDLKDSLLNGTAPEFASVVRDRKDVFELQDENGWNLLHLIVLYNKTDIVQQLADLIANKHVVLNCQDNDGMTPLAHATYLGREKMVLLLLRLGASQFIRDHEGLSALDWAELSGSIICHSVLSIHNMQQEVYQMGEKLAAISEEGRHKGKKTWSLVVLSSFLVAALAFLVKRFW